MDEQVNKLCEFAQWVRTNFNRSASVDISIWCHAGSERQSVEYRFWIDEIILKRSNDIHELVGMIPKFKQYCELHKELAA